MRADNVIAKIEKINKKSQNLFKGISFKEVKLLENEIEYHINRENFF